MFCTGKCNGLFHRYCPGVFVLLLEEMKTTSATATAPIPGTERVQFLCLISTQKAQKEEVHELKSIIAAMKLKMQCAKAEQAMCKSCLHLWLLVATLVSLRRLLLLQHQQDQHRDLGIIMSNNLSWNAHYSPMPTKCFIYCDMFLAQIIVLRIKELFMYH